MSLIYLSLQQHYIKASNLFNTTPSENRQKKARHLKHTWEHDEPKMKGTYLEADINVLSN